MYNLKINYLLNNLKINLKKIIWMILIVYYVANVKIVFFEYQNLFKIKFWH